MGATHISWHADKTCGCYSICGLTRLASDFESPAVVYECGGDVPVDHAFWFSLRDAQAFGKTESFGLVDTCDAPTCKVASSPSFRTDDYQAVDVGQNMSCSGPVLFNGWSRGEGNCRDKCS